MSMRDYPLFVSAENGNLEPCEKGLECGLWGTGLVRVSNEKGGTYSTVDILTMAGCSVCEVPCVTQGDIGPFDHSEDNQYQDGALKDKTSHESALAKKVQSFLPAE
jgi:hypothetical protein